MTSDIRIEIVPTPTDAQPISSETFFENPEYTGWASTTFTMHLNKLETVAAEAAEVFGQSDGFWSEIYKMDEAYTGTDRSELGHSPASQEMIDRYNKAIMAIQSVVLGL